MPAFKAAWPEWLSIKRAAPTPQPESHEIGASTDDAGRQKELEAQQERATQDRIERESIKGDEQSSSDGFEKEPVPIAQGPPSLEYTLETRRLSIFLFWSLILIDSIAIPIALYFGLWYGTDLSPNAVFSISTGALGGVSIVEYVLRFWRLWRKGSTCRVIGGRRAYLDWFHWNFSIAWIFIMAELIIGTVFKDPPIRLLAMPLSSLCFWFAFQLLVLDTLRILGFKSHVRISSMPKGTHLRPGIYAIIEDVVAVDGSGGTEFRERLNARYQASKDFRMMLHRLTLFWAFGALFAAILTTILVFTLERDAAYVCGWVVPFIWAGAATYATIQYVRVCLAHEKRDWGRAKDTMKILRV